MSDIAKKTLPLGARLGQKKAPSTVGEGSEVIPRFVSGGDDANQGDGQQHQTYSDDEGQESNYAHHQGVTKDADSKLQQPWARANNNNNNKNNSDTNDEDTSQTKIDDLDSGIDAGSPDLTEKTMQGFDEASQNQPNHDARGSFLKAGQEGEFGVACDGDRASSAKKLAEQANPESLVSKVKGQLPADQEEGHEGEGGHNEAIFMCQTQKLESETGDDFQDEAKFRAPIEQQGIEEEIDIEEQHDGTQLTSELKFQDVSSQNGSKAQNLGIYMPEQAQQQKLKLSIEAGEDACGTVKENDVAEDQRSALATLLPQLPPEVQSQLASQLGSALDTNQLDALSQLGVEALAETRPGEGVEDDQMSAQEGTEIELTNPPSGTAPTLSAEDQGTVVEDEGNPLDFSVLKNGRVNKGGNVVDQDGKVVGRVVQGFLSFLIGKRVDEKGDIWSDTGKIIAKAVPFSTREREDLSRETQPFESFPDSVVDADGMVVSNGEFIGKVVAGDLKQLRGKRVDADGEILDKAGNVIGRAERWEPEPDAEPEPEPEVDCSALAGKRVNKAGNVVDSSGTIYGRVMEGNLQNMVGRMCDRNGQILSESGDVIGRAEVVPEGEREGFNEGPFAELQGCTVAKNGTVVTLSGQIVGRLVSGDPKILNGRAVDEDGDVIDRNGNALGKAERWEPEPEPEKKQNVMAGRRVNKQGDVVDEDGNLVGKLTTGSLSICVGKEIDGDGDVVDNKGTVIGHVSLLAEIPMVEPEEGAEKKAKREQAEQDKKLAAHMAVCIEQCLDKIRPICKMITEKIDHAERQPDDQRDEEQLVKEVRPLIEEGGRILTEAKGIIKGLDPAGRISANAKHKTAAREATAEEYHLADVLKDLTGEVTECIENAKRKIEDMPHAKKELNPLWGLLNEPLFQILAAVGLLLNGVLSLVGKLLSGLGLGGLLDGLLGTLGLNRVLESLGLGQVTQSLTGGGRKGKSGGGGGLLGGLLGGK